MRKYGYGTLSEKVDVTDICRRSKDHRRARERTVVRAKEAERRRRRWRAVRAIRPRHHSRHDQAFPRRRPLDRFDLEHPARERILSIFGPNGHCPGKST